MPRPGSYCGETIPLARTFLSVWWEPWACHQATFLQTGSISQDDPGRSRSTADGIALSGHMPLRATPPPPAQYSCKGLIVQQEMEGVKG